MMVDDRSVSFKERAYANYQDEMASLETVEKMLRTQERSEVEAYREPWFEYRIQPTHPRRYKEELPECTSRSLLMTSCQGAFLSGATIEQNPLTAYLYLATVEL